MTALYMNENVFSTKEEFYVKDSEGKNRYKVGGMVLSLNKQIEIYDLKNRRPVARVAKPLVSFLADTYDIYVKGKKIAVIHKPIVQIFPWTRHTVGKLNWDVNGSILDHDFTLVKGLKKIASIHRKWMSFGDCYELHIQDEKDELAVLAVTVGLNAIETDHRISKNLKK